MKTVIQRMLGIFLAGLLAGCVPASLPQPTPTAQPQPSFTALPSPVPTQTPAPTETVTPEPTLTHTVVFIPPPTRETPLVTQTPQLTTTPDARWKLAWADEFDQPDGSGVNPKYWSFDTGGLGWGNSELECYTDRTENASIHNGALVIKAQPEKYQGCDYTSARLVTKGKADWAYGRFEIRAKLPRTQGLWPAIWLLPTDNVYGDWPDSGEIDIMELLGDNPYKIYGTAHYGSPHSSMGGEFELPASAPSFADDFHVFALEWDATELRWYVDGLEYFSTNTWFTSGPNGKFPAPFNQRFHILLNVAVGGVWPGNPDQTTQWPQTMMVDYVRVYKK